MNKNGFTFIEVLISLTLLSFIVVTTIPLFSQINKICLKSKCQYELGKLAENYMEEIKASGNISIEKEKYFLDDFMEKETIIFSDPYEIKVMVKKSSLQPILHVYFHITHKKTKEIYTLSSYIYSKTHKEYHELSLKE